MELTKIKNDVNGNPRYVVHFLELIGTEKGSVLEKYQIALKKAKTIGGKKYNNKSYGGGIVFQSYNTKNLIEKIKNAKKTTHGLNAPQTKGFRTLSAKTVGVTGLRKKNGTLKKGYVYKKGGKIVKTATKK
jgi:hypothetical protein